MHRLYHDFNKVGPGTADHLRTAPLVCFGTHEDLKRQSMVLREGLEVLLYMPDCDENARPGALEVKGVIRKEEKEGCFVADFVWDDLKFVLAVEDEKSA